MESSNQINQVVIDGELANVSIDEETGLFFQEEDQTIVYSHEEESQEERKPRFWRRVRFGGKTNGKKDGNDKDAESDKADTVEEDSEESGGAGKDDLAKAFGNFGASLLNVCTLGLFSSGDSSSEQPSATPDKIVRDLTASEQEMHMIEEEMVDSEQNQYRRGREGETSDGAVMSTSSANSDADSNSAMSMVSRLSKKKKMETVFFYSIGIVCFLAMCGFFVAGGILLKRNGW